MFIRRAKEKDIPGINELLRQVCLVHHIGRPDLFKYGARKYSDEQLIEIINDAERPILVAADESDNILGYTFCIIQQRLEHNILTDIKTLYIDDICVDENQRGRHIGTAIYNAVFDLARELGCYNITLNVWSCNPGAIKFYEACGMVPQKIGMEHILGDAN